jgi:hypothetical protein
MENHKSISTMSIPNLWKYTVHRTVLERKSQNIMCQFPDIFRLVMPTTEEEGPEQSKKDRI